jgi:hypothetical protein
MLPKPLLNKTMNIVKFNLYNELLDKIENLPNSCKILLEWNLNIPGKFYSDLLFGSEEGMNCYDLIYFDIKDGIREQKYLREYGDISQIKKTYFDLSLI